MIEVNLGHGTTLFHLPRKHHFEYDSKTKSLVG